MRERSAEELHAMGIRFARILDKEGWSVRDSLGCLAHLIVGIANTSDVARNEVYEAIALGFQLVDQRKRGPS